MRETSEESPRRSVLIVEDDVLVSDFMARALAMAGFDSVHAISAGAAMAVIEVHPELCAVLIDGLLPDMHGADLAREILDHEHGARLPLCFVSGALRDSVPLTSGISALAKPVRAAELIRMARELADWHETGGTPIEERRATLDRFVAGFLVGR